MERLWDPGAALKGTQLHWGKQAGCWMRGDSASTSPRFFPTLQAGGGLSICCYSGERCPCNHILCDLRQNWKSNVLSSNATGHAKLQYSADLCSLQRCFHPPHQRRKVRALQSSQERVTDLLRWALLWLPSVAPGNVPLKPIFNYSAQAAEIDTVMWLLPDQKEAQTNPKQAASAP